MNFEVIYYNDGKQVTAEFNTEKQAISFAMKVKGMVLQDKEVLEDFSE
jgi:hypothetical protein